MQPNFKEKYRELCRQRADIPLFIQDWWMDAVCGKSNWNVLMHCIDDKPVGVLVYYFIKRKGFLIIVQPVLTQTTGIWLNYPENLSHTRKLDFENAVYNVLINQINELELSYFDQNFNPRYTNWLPFYWKGFMQTTRYSYQITDLSDLNRCFENFTYAKRKQINKAKHALHAVFDMTGENFYSHLEINLKKKQNKAVEYSRSVFMALYDACIKRGQGRIIAVADDVGNIHAALFLVWDSSVAYNLISSINPDFKSSGASTLAVWEAINEMAKYVNIFDFEGSMNKGIENSFRQFGTVQTPYFRIYKHNSQILKMLFALKKYIFYHCYPIKNAD